MHSLSHHQIEGTGKAVEAMKSAFSGANTEAQKSTKMLIDACTAAARGYAPPNVDDSLATHVAIPVPPSSGAWPENRIASGGDVGGGVGVAGGPVGTGVGGVDGTPRVDGGGAGGTGNPDRELSPSH
jgi:hypothetical protein